MRTSVLFDHLLPSASAATVAGVVDYAFFGSLLRGAGVGCIAGVVYSATHDILENSLKSKSGFVNHSVAIITSASITYGVALAAASAGLIAMPTLASFGALYAMAIAVDIIFRAFLNEKPKAPPAAPPPVKEAPGVPVKQNAKAPTLTKPKRHVATTAPSTKPVKAIVPTTPATNLVQQVGQLVKPATVSPPPIPQLTPEEIARQVRIQQYERDLAAMKDVKNPILTVMLEKKFDMADWLLSKGVKPDFQDDDGNAPLLIAVSEGQADLVEKFIVSGAKVDVVDDKQNTTLHLAAAAGNLRLVTRFLTAPNKEARNASGETPLASAVRHGHLDVAKLLEGQGSNLKVLTNANETLLHLACSEKGDPKVVEWVYGLMPDAKAAQNKRSYPLLSALSAGKKSVAEWLLNKGADLQCQDRAGNTSLSLALSQGFDELAQDLLTKHGVKVDFKDKEQNTALHLAAGACNKTIKRYFTPADKDARNVYGVSPLAAAVWHGHLEAAKFLVRKNASPKTLTNAKETLLHIAATRSDDASLLQWVYDLWPEALNEKDVNGCTPLHSALKARKAGTAAWLSNIAGADVHCRDNEGNTPTSMAVRNGLKEAAGALVAKGAKDDCVDNDQNTLSHLAAFSGNVPLVEQFHSVAPPETRNKSGMTPLGMAVWNGQKAAAQCLLGKGADPKTETADKQTLLHLAASETGNLGRLPSGCTNWRKMPSMRRMPMGGRHSSQRWQQVNLALQSGY